MSKSVFMVVTSAIVLAGEIAKPGTLIEVTEAEANDFQRRGKARRATVADGVPAEEPHPEPTPEAKPAAKSKTVAKPAAETAGEEKAKPE